MQSEAEDIDEGLSSTFAMVKVDPSPEASYVVPSSAALGSTS